MQDDLDDYEEPFDLATVAADIDDLQSIVVGTVGALALDTKPSIMVPARRDEDDHIPALPREEVPPVDPEIAALDTGIEELDEDFQRARSALQNIIRDGAEAVREAAIVAKSSDHDKAYTALASLINAMTTANDKMMELHMRRQKMLLELRKSKKENSNPTNSAATPSTQVANTAPTTNTTNVMFVGSTSDLLQTLRKRTDVPVEVDLKKAEEEQPI